MNGVEKIRLYWNTGKSLKPIQIKYQIKNRIWRNRKEKYWLQVKKLHRPKEWTEIELFIPELDCRTNYLQKFPEDKLFKNEVELLHETHRIEKKWYISEASHLWNYNLHYLEFLIPLAVKYSNTREEAYYLKWKKLIEDWLEQSTGDSFEPYPISMRIPNLLICMELMKEKLQDTELEVKIRTSLYQQYRYLLLTQEKALLANHYFENLKAILISSLLFQELDVYHKYFDLFLKEIEEQILPDGLHFERSLMYHKIILEDLLRVYPTLNSTHHTEDAKKLIPTIRLMTSAMVNLEQGFDRTPLFNDAGNNVSKDPRALLRAAERLCKYKETEEIEKTELTSFDASGYYKQYKNGIAVLFDCGEIGPSYMGGHAHCDCLSFELCVNGKALFVNSGTGQYQGELRSFFRSTAAHNTMMIDDREQSELWGEHRAARRIRRVKGKGSKNVLSGRFQSYMGDSFCRRLRWEKDQTLLITDVFKAQDRKTHVARQFLHLAPGCHYERNGKQIDVMEGKELLAVIKLPKGCDDLIHTQGLLTAYAEDFGEYQKKQVLEIRTHFQDKVHIQMEIEIRKRDKL